MYTPHFSREKAREREEEEGGWNTPAAVAEVVPVGSETSCEPLPDPEPWSRVKTNRQPARRQTGKPITDFADSLNGDLLYFQMSQSLII